MATRQGKGRRKAQGGGKKSLLPTPRVSREVDQRAGAFPHPFRGREVSSEHIQRRCGANWAPPDNSYSHKCSQTQRRFCVSHLGWLGPHRVCLSHGQGRWI
eukprot:scaffold10113_cov150-Isochrysis_galbana.AAC.7